MFSSLTQWWSDRQKKEKLKKDFLAERNDIVFLHALGELKEEWAVASAALDARYLKLGLSKEDIDLVKRRNEWVRIE